MPGPSVTYTFTNGTTADATQVNQNFTDIINGLTDGTKDLTISALTVQGAAAFNANVTFGNAASDTVSFTSIVPTSIIQTMTVAERRHEITQSAATSTITSAPLFVDFTNTTGSNAPAAFFRGASDTGNGVLRLDRNASATGDSPVLLLQTNGTGANIIRGLNDLAGTPTQVFKISSLGVATFHGGVVFDEAAGQGTLNNYVVGTSWTANLSATANLSGTPSASKQSYTRIGNLVTFQMRVTGFSQTAAAPTRTLFSFDLPIASSANGDPINGTVVVFNATEDVGLLVRNSGSTTACFAAWRATTMTGAVTIDVFGSYYVL